MCRLVAHIFFGFPLPVRVCCSLNSTPRYLEPLRSVGMAVVSETADGQRNLHVVDSFVHAHPSCVSYGVPRCRSILVLEKIVGATPSAAGYSCKPLLS
jgi:hypothetical protein